jgi:hypothetical protein
MNKWIIAIVAATALAGCKTHSGSSHGYGHAGNVESITYETGPCFGTCPVYTVTVHANGSGLFVGHSHTTVTGNQSFTVTHSQFAQFLNQLAPVRPASGTVRHASGSDCTSMVTDLPSTDVKWNGVNGQQQELFVYHGCRFPGSQAMINRLQQAPGLLPIGSFIH